MAGIHALRKFVDDRKWRQCGFRKPWSVVESRIAPDLARHYGRFEFTGNIHDQFQVVLRTDGVTTNPSAEFDNGIHFKFAIESDTGSTANQVYISDTSYPQETFLALGTFPLSLNTFYNFWITDDGTNLALYINDFVNPFLTATDSNFYGSQLGLYNREGNGAISAGSVTQLDFINVVPEPSSFLLLILGALCFAASFGRSEKASKSLVR